MTKANDLRSKKKTEYQGEYFHQQIVVTQCLKSVAFTAVIARGRKTEPVSCKHPDNDFTSKFPRFLSCLNSD